MSDRNAEQDNLFKEIDEDLRQQKYENLWKKYGKIIIGTLVALVLGVASIKGWEAYSLNLKTTDSNLLSSALKSIDREETEDAVAVLNNLIKSGTTGYSVLAQFNRAAILVKKGEKKKAIDYYLKIAADTRIEKVLRDMALIKSAYLGLEYGDPTIFLKKLPKLININNTWRHSAKELSALFAQKLDNKIKANQLYKELADDPTAPTSMRSRAAEMAIILNKKNN
jgi:hypothetical protein